MPFLNKSAPVALALLVLGGLGCAEGAGPTLGSISRQQAAVHETLRIPLVVESVGTRTVYLRFEGPELAGLDRTAFITGDGRGGEFRWTPLPSHVGTHEFLFVLTDGSGRVMDRELAVIEVRPSSDAAPVFLRPGAGASFDLTREPCLSFEVEVRDDDSSRVEIRERKELPEGATLTMDGPKRAYLDWCPTPDQAAAQERWTIQLEADDGDHPPTEHDFIAVLRAGMKEDCPGEPPRVSIVSPSSRERISSGSGYTVSLDVSDDIGLRDAPLVYYSTHAPDDLSSPDLSAFELLTALPDGRGWRARIPSLGVREGEERDVYIVASATDNDDSTGALCDHRTDTGVRRFIAVGSTSAGDLLTCAPCSSSTECASNICATTASGGRCLDSCGSGGTCAEGTCEGTSLVEGARVDACGSVLVVCEGGGDAMGCVDDSREDNDTVDSATSGVSSFSDGKICAEDVDYFRIDVSRSSLVSVSIDFTHSSGDLDLRLVNSSGTILESSAGVEDTESVSHCQPEASALYARVEGFMGEENGYSFRVTQRDDTCCTDDALEDDDDLGSARSFTPGSGFSGTVCPSDDDYRRFTVSSPGALEATLLLDPGAGDLDLALYGPSGALVAESTGITDTETIREDVTETGTYTLRVFGFLGEGGDYIGDVDITASSGCTNSAECPTDQVCAGSPMRCGPGACTEDSDCPSGHICPPTGSGTRSSVCGEACTVNRDCKTSEACKWFSRGRYCGERGGAANGAACSSYHECGGQRACLAWSGGYCARAGCTSDADCETGTLCVGSSVGSSTVNVCAVDCLWSDDICRLSEGYTCSIATGVASSSLEFVCLPGSS